MVEKEEAMEKLDTSGDEGAGARAGMRRPRDPRRTYSLV
jgi:hypothetical protein